MKAWLVKLQGRLVPEWREVWRYWSFRLGAIGTALAGWFVAFPESALHAWAMLPDDVKAMLPPQVVGYVGIAMFALSILSKWIDQKNLPSRRQ